MVVPESFAEADFVAIAVVVGFVGLVVVVAVGFLFLLTSFLRLIDLFLNY